MTGYAVATEQKLAMLAFAHSTVGQRIAAGLAAEAAALPIDHPRIKQAAWEWTASLDYALREATPYYISPDVCAALVAAAPGVPDYVLHREDLPTTCGWLYFSRPLVLQHDAENANDIRDLVACTWTPVHRDDENLPIQTLAGKPAGAKASFGGSLEGAFGISVQFFVASDLRAGGIPIAQLVWHFGEGFEHCWRTSADTIDPDGKPSLSDVAREELRYLATAILFMGQELFPTRRESLPRDTRKRLTRAGFDPASTTNTPHVVYLRRVGKRPDNDDDTTETRHFDHRFWVRGHWRNHWYPKELRHKPMWIHPVLKGPEGAPIAPRKDALFAVVR